MVGNNVPKPFKTKLYYYKKEKYIMIYEFCNTYNIYKYCAVEADCLEEAIIRLQLPENKFERKSDKETLINTTYRYHLDDGQLIRKSFDLF